MDRKMDEPHVSVTSQKSEDSKTNFAYRTCHRRPLCSQQQEQTRCLSLCTPKSVILMSLMNVAPV